MARHVRPAGRPTNGRTQQHAPDRSPTDGRAPLAASAGASPDGDGKPNEAGNEAVRRFERGMRALQQHDYRTAADHFQAVITEFPSERALVERSQVYLALCQREVDRRPAAPRTVEERLTAATAALNNGEDDEAERLVRSVLDTDPSHELALYLLAAVEARRGARDSALDLLTRAFDVSPEIRAQVRHDMDFEPLRELEAFQQLLDAPIVRDDPTGPARRPRRPRAGR